MVLIRTNIAFPYFLSSVHSPTRMGNKLQVLHPAANMPDGSFSLIFFPQGFFKKGPAASYVPLCRNEARPEGPEYPLCSIVRETACFHKKPRLCLRNIITWETNNRTREIKDNHAFPTFSGTCSAQILSCPKFVCQKQILLFRQIKRHPKRHPEEAEEAPPDKKYGLRQDFPTGGRY